MDVEWGKVKVICFFVSTMSNENGFSKDILSSEDEMGMSETQHNQVPLGKGRFTGQVYIPETKSESGKNSSDDERLL